MPSWRHVAHGRDQQTRVVARLSQADTETKSSDSPVVFVSMPAGSHVGNLVRSGCVPALRTGGFHVVVLSPFADDPDFQAEFAGQDVDVVPLKPWRPSAADRVVESLLSERFLIESRLHAVRLQRDRARLLEPSASRALLASAKTILARVPVPRRELYRLAGVVRRDGDLDALFLRYRPVMLVTASAGFHTAEIPLIHAARRARTPQMAVDLGWDNLVSKYHTLMPVDFLAVWNEDMKAQAVRYHGFAPSRVRVVGAGQFDDYFGDRSRWSRQDLLRVSGLAPDRAVITIATAPHTMYPDTPWLIDLLARAVERDQLGVAAQLLVRVHPRDDLLQYQPLEGRPHVRVEKPVRRLSGVKGTPPFDEFCPSASDQQRLALTLACSDVVVNFASTTTIEACILDTPVVTVGFDREPGLPVALSVRRYFEFEHYQPVIETRAADIASSPLGMLELLQRHLRDRSAGSDARRALVNRVCTFQDGKSAERITAAVLHALRTAHTGEQPS